MIYCVVPEALADELYDKLVAYYADDDNVEVIIDRRQGSTRAVAAVATRSVVSSARCATAGAPGCPASSRELELADD